jgi:hypothetical protein
MKKKKLSICEPYYPYVHRQNILNPSDLSFFLLATVVIDTGGAP